MRLNHRQVEAFRAVFQTGSMTAAGALMGITQPAVTRLVRDFEAEIKVPLFERKGGRVSATPDAVTLYQEVQRSFHGLDRVARAAAELSRRRSGELRIAASVAPSFFCLPQVIARFRAAWPGVSLSLRTCSSPEVLDLAARQQCDLGVAVAAAEGPGVEIEPLPAQNAVCILPEQHSLAARRVIRPNHLAGSSLLMISDYSLLHQRIMQTLEAAGITFDIVFEASFSATICGLVAEGFGVSILDPLTARAYEGRGIVVRRFEPPVPYELKLVYPAAQPRAERVLSFVALLRGTLEARRA
jgi:DNA-binding transcriptional LysR family regulator